MMLMFKIGATAAIKINPNIKILMYFIMVTKVFGFMVFYFGY